MGKYELQKLRDLPIEGVAERLGLQVKMHKALCPFHDDHHASCRLVSEETPSAALSAEHLAVPSTW